MERPIPPLAKRLMKLPPGFFINVNESYLRCGKVGSEWKRQIIAKPFQRQSESEQKKAQAEGGDRRCAAQLRGRQVQFPTGRKFQKDSLARSANVRLRGSSK